MQKLIRAKDLDRLARAIHQMKARGRRVRFPGNHDGRGISGGLHQTRRRDQLDRFTGRSARKADSPGGWIPAIGRSPPAEAQTSENQAGLSSTSAVPMPRHRREFMWTWKPAWRIARASMERLSAEIAMARRSGKLLACIAIRIADLGLGKHRQAEEAAVAVIQRIAGALETRCQNDCQAFRADPSHLVVLAPGRGSCRRGTSRQRAGRIDCRPEVCRHCRRRGRALRLRSVATDAHDRRRLGHARRRDEADRRRHSTDPARAHAGSLQPANAAHGMSPQAAESPGI